MSVDSQKSEASGSRFSLHRLSAAFARLTGTAESQEPSESNGEQADIDGQSRPTVAGNVVLSPRMIVEGMLFVGHAEGKPLTNRSMAAHIRDVSPQEVDAIVKNLIESYVANGCSYTIVSEGAGYRMQLRTEHEALRQRMSGRTKQARLTPQAIEVLSVVAYRQPISAEDVSKVRGSRSDALLNQLIRRGLLELQRPDSTANAVYRTTDRFNQLLSIRSPADLPRSEDLDDN